MRISVLPSFTTSRHEVQAPDGQLPESVVGHRRPRVLRSKFFFRDGEKEKAEIGFCRNDTTECGPSGGQHGVYDARRSTR